MPGVRVRTASDKKKALIQYEELRDAGGIESAIVIVEKKDGNITALGQGMRPFRLGQILLYVAQALRNLMDQNNKIAAEPLSRDLDLGAMTTGDTMKVRGITKTPDGGFLPPAGENFISCGVCRHPRWHITLRDSDQNPARFACAHCGNEIVLHLMSRTPH